MNVKNVSACRPVSRQSKAGEVTVHSGLSVIVAGHLIALDRDELYRVACVVVGAIKHHQPSLLDLPDIKVAAYLLGQRARRVLGQDWTVVDWSVPDEG